MMKKILCLMLALAMYLSLSGMAFAGCVNAGVDDDSVFYQGTDADYVISYDKKLNTMTIERYAHDTGVKERSAVGNLEKGIVTVQTYKNDGSAEIQVIENEPTGIEPQTVSGSRTTRSKYAYNYRNSTSCYVACPAFAGNSDAIYSFTTFEHAGNINDLDNFRDAVNQIYADEEGLALFITASKATTLINEALALAINPLDFGEVLRASVDEITSSAEAQSRALQIGVSQDRAQVIYNRLQEDYISLMRLEQ